MSNINYLSINENFPVAGQDNDTQVFRDNFDTIKTSLRLAQEEITALQDATGGLNSTAEENGSNFAGRVINDVVLKQSRQAQIDLNTTPRDYADFGDGHYQKFVLTGDISAFKFKFFPGDPNASEIIDTVDSVGKVVLEFTSQSDVDRKIKFTTSESGATAIKKANFPALTLPGDHDLEVSSESNPVIIEVWRYGLDSAGNDNIYINYIGQFS